MYLLLKNILDRSIAGLMLLIAILPLTLVGIIGSMLDRRPILFSQPRGGIRGEVFTIYKLRTMKGGKITPFGRFLRRWSVDELPQLWNILIGDMSFVGPRPLLTEYADFYSPVQNRRHEVLPGVTGLAQVSGRNELSWQRRFELDVEYVDRQSFWLDMKILLKTVIRVFDHKSADFHLNGIPKFSEQKF